MANVRDVAWDSVPGRRNVSIAEMMRDVAWDSVPGRRNVSIAEMMIDLPKMGMRCVFSDIVSS